MNLPTHNVRYMYISLSLFRSLCLCLSLCLCIFLMSLCLPLCPFLSVFRVHTCISSIQTSIHPSINPSIQWFSARWCPIVPSLPHHVSRLLGWLWYPGLPPVLVSIAFPFVFHISVFLYPLFFPCHCHFIRVSSLRPKYLQPFGRPFTYFIGEFLASLLYLLWYPMLWSQRLSNGAHGAEISIQISALAGVEPRTLVSSGRERYH